MKLFDKIKNILFEDEETEIPVIKKEEPKKEETREFTAPENKVPSVPRFRNTNYEPVKEEPVKPEVEEKSPFQQFDEEEFERIAALNKSRLLERDRKLREEKEREKTTHYTPERTPEERKVERPTHHLDNVIKKEVTNEAKHFTPSPVISPVYGILDKNYTKNDLLPKASSEGTLPKVIDVDSVRKKAFGTLEEDLKGELDDNESEEPIELLEDASEVIGGYDDEDEIKSSTDDIKITSFEDQVDEDNSKVEENNDDYYIEPPVDDSKTIEELDSMLPDKDTKEKIEEDKKESDSLESDLFNLIDSMYQDKEENK